MYAPFFGLQREPFSIAPDPHFLYMSEAHREALAHLLYGLAGGGGFVLLTGEIGAGKTTVCRCFLDQVPADTDVAYIFNPKLSATELLQTVCEEFGIDVPATAATPATIKDHVDALNRFLLASHAAGRHAVLIIDEAQALSAEVLEQLRLLTNLETAERKLLQIVLIGQPELRALLARPELEQLAQRVIARYHLPALSEAETAAYVRHRLAVAGLASQMPFDGGALRRLHALCGGVPRRINLLADRALLGGYASGRARIDRGIVDRAAREVFGTEPAARGRLVWALGGLVVALVAAALLAQRSRMAAPAAATGLAAASAASASDFALPRGLAATRGQAAATAAAASDVAAASGTAASAGLAPSAAVGATRTAVADGAPALVDAAAVFAAAARGESHALRELAALWRLPLTDGADACAAVQRAGVQCFRGSVALTQVRDLGRPGLLTLHDAQDRPAWALVTGIDDEAATLVLGGQQRRLPLVSLTLLWRGDFTTLWRTPPGWPADAAAWMATRLPGGPEQPMKSRIVAFQVAHGLKPDGVAGPMTLMQINRAAGGDEPRLATSTAR